MKWKKFKKKYLVISIDIIQFYSLLFIFYGFVCVCPNIFIWACDQTSISNVCEPN